MAKKIPTAEELQHASDEIGRACAIIEEINELLYYDDEEGCWAEPKDDPYIDDLYETRDKLDELQSRLGSAADELRKAAPKPSRKTKSAKAGQ